MYAPNLEKEAEELLESPDLLPRLESFIEDNGLVGEETNRRLILLSGIGGHLENPIHVIVKGPSSGGKNNLVNTSLSPLPPGRIKRAAHVSKKALAYTEKLEGVLLIEEAEGQKTAEYAIRVAMSEGRVGNLTVAPDEDGVYQQREMTADISASIITTTTSPSLHPENQTRVFDVEIDASRELTRKVIDDFAARAAGRVNEPDSHERDVIETAMGLLSPEEKKILVPFADHFANHFPPDTVRARRDFPRVLCLIRASTLLHQRQRNRDAEGHLLAEVEDYQVVYPILQKVLEPSMTGLTKTARQLCELHNELAEESTDGWVRRTDLEDLADERDVASRNTVHKWCKELSKPDCGIWEGDRRGRRQAWHHRKLRDPDEPISLPEPEEVTP